MMWLSEIPAAVIRSCLVMLPRLEAEEAIGRVNQAALGSGALDASESSRLRTALAAAVGSPVTRRPDPSVLAGMGFAVRRVRRAVRT